MDEEWKEGVEKGQKKTERRKARKVGKRKSKEEDKKSLCDKQGNTIQKRGERGVGYKATPKRP